MKKKLGLSKKITYPVSSLFISKKDINSVNNILMNGRISSNGTVALEIDVKALGIKKKTNRLHL